MTHYEEYIPTPPMVKLWRPAKMGVSSFRLVILQILWIAATTEHGGGVLSQSFCSGVQHFSFDCGLREGYDRLFGKMDCSTGAVIEILPTPLVDVVNGTLASAFSGEVYICVYNATQSGRQQLPTRYFSVAVLPGPSSSCLMEEVRCGDGSFFDACEPCADSPMPMPSPPTPSPSQSPSPTGDPAANTSSDNPSTIAVLAAALAIVVVIVCLICSAIYVIRKREDIRRWLRQKFASGNPPPAHAVGEQEEQGDLAAAIGPEAVPRHPPPPNQVHLEVIGVEEHRPGSPRHADTPEPHADRANETCVSQEERQFPQEENKIPRTYTNDSGFGASQSGRSEVDPEQLNVYEQSHITRKIICQPSRDKDEGLGAVE